MAKALIVSREQGRALRRRLERVDDVADMMAEAGCPSPRSEVTWAAWTLAERAASGEIVLDNELQRDVLLAVVETREVAERLEEFLRDTR